MTMEVDMKRMKTAALTVLLSSVFVLTLFAQSDEEMFGGDLFAEPAPQAAQDQAPDLTAGTLGIRLGGRFGFRADETVLWRDLGIEDIWNPTETGMAPSLEATVSLDARPDEHFRVYLGADLSYPFTENATRNATDILRIRELFADWDWENTLFFRAGKHAIHWGTGYFFSPADVLNLTPIDPEDPEADREGPLSLRMDWPFGLNGVRLYVIAQDVQEWTDLGVAAKADIVIGDAELGIGAFYRNSVSPRFIALATFPIWKMSWFAEGVASYGSDRTYVVDGDGGALEAVTYEDGLFIQATAGFRIKLTDIFVDSEDIVLTAQYLYDGTGYEDASILQLPQVHGLIVAGSILPSDLKNTGMHYAAARLSWTGMFGSDFSNSFSWISNLSDGSGRFQSGLSLDLFDRFTASVAISVSYGDQGDEFTPLGSDTVLHLTLDAGSGRF
jgi:hypothetical protein